MNGINFEDWDNVYGMSTNGDELSMRYVTESQFYYNLGGRVYLMEGDEYKLFRLLNKEFTFTVDTSQIGCGFNGAVFFSEMPGSSSRSLRRISAAPSS